MEYIYICQNFNSEIWLKNGECRVALGWGNKLIPHFSQKMGVIPYHEIWFQICQTSSSCLMKYWHFRLQTNFFVIQKYLVQLPQLASFDSSQDLICPGLLEPPLGYGSHTLKVWRCKFISSNIGSTWMHFVLLIPYLFFLCCTVFKLFLLYFFALVVGQVV